MGVVRSGGHIEKGLRHQFGARSTVMTIGDLIKATSGGPYIGPRGGKYADAAHTRPWKTPAGARPINHDKHGGYMKGWGELHYPSKEHAERAYEQHRADWAETAAEYRKNAAKLAAHSKKGLASDEGAGPGLHDRRRELERKLTTHYSAAAALEIHLGKRKPGSDRRPMQKGDEPKLTPEETKAVFYRSLAQEARNALQYPDRSPGGAPSQPLTLDQLAERLEDDMIRRMGYDQSHVAAVRAVGGIDALPVICAAMARRAMEEHAAGRMAA